MHINKDKYTIYISDTYRKNYHWLNTLIAHQLQIDVYSRLKEYKIALLQTDLEAMPLKNTINLFPNNNDLTYIDRQNIHDSIERYLNICKKFKLDTFSDISDNKCILDPLGEPIENISNVRLDVTEVNTKLLELLSKYPNYIYQLSSRKFEEVIAEIMIQMGYSIELTPATHDGGKDIYVAQKTDLGSFLYLVECKKYNPSHKVGVNVIRNLYGVVSKEKATAGIVVTTSYFSKTAKDFQQEIPFQMSLKDFDSIKQWLHEIT